MFSSARDLSIFLAACLDGEAPIRSCDDALQMTQRENVRVSARSSDRRWRGKNIDVDGVGVVDKPGGLNNATAYIGLVPAQRSAFAARQPRRVSA